MGYNSPQNAISQAVLTTNFWNSQVRDNITFLYTTINSTQGSVALTQGSVIVVNNTLAITQGLVSNTQGSVTATQGSVAATQGSVVALGGTAGTAWSITAIAGTAGTAVNLTATQGSVAAIAGTISTNTQAQPIGTITTNYTLGTADAGKFFKVTGNATITIPANGSAAFAIGQRMDFMQTGGSNLGVSFAAATGVTIYYTPSATLRALYSGASLVKLDTNTWALVGDLN